MFKTLKGFLSLEVQSFLVAKQSLRKQKKLPEAQVAQDLVSLLELLELGGYIRIVRCKNRNYKLNVTNRNIVFAWREVESQWD